MSPTAAKPRYHYFDILKGVAILMVLINHVLIFVLDIDSSFLHTFNHQVDMPLFFFISGYFTYKAGYAAPNLRGRFLQLIVPIACLIPLWYLYMPHSHLPEFSYGSIAEIWSVEFKAGYWFPLCLFEMMVLYCLLAPVFRRFTGTGIQVAVTLVAFLGLFAIPMIYYPLGFSRLTGILGMNPLHDYFMVFMFGVFYHKQEEWINRQLGRDVVVTLLMVVWLVMFWLTSYTLHAASERIPYWSNMLLTSPLMMMTVVPLAVLLVRPWSEREFAPGHKPGFFARQLTFLGTHSYDIYLLHFFFLFPAHSLGTMLQETGLQLVPLLAVSGVIAVGVGCASLLAAHLLKQSNLVGFLLLGQRFKGWK